MADPEKIYEDLNILRHRIVNQVTSIRLHAKALDSLSRALEADQDYLNRITEDVEKYVDDIHAEEVRKAYIARPKIGEATKDEDSSIFIDPNGL